MITARGASAARRDGDDAAPRPTARPRRGRTGVVSGVSSAVAVSLSVALATAACASSPRPEVDSRLLPGNQDTGAAERNLPVPPAARAQTAYQAADPPTVTVSPFKYTSPQDAWTKMAIILTGSAPKAELTPQQNTTGSSTSTASPLPPLEVLSMPMWLWVDSPGSMVAEVQDGPDNIYVVDTVVIDEVQWYLDGSAAPWMTCGSLTQPIAPTPTSANPPSSGPGVPYSTDMDPGNAGDDQPLACVNQGFATPYYQPSTVSGSPTTVDGVHKLQAQVHWHVDYVEYGLDGYPVAGGYGQAQGITTPAMSNTLTFRVGEIQALVTKP